MKPAAFDYVRAETADEVLSGLAQEGGNACVLAGGQSLMAMINMRLAKPKLLIDIMRIKELRQIERKAGAVLIGAGVRQAELLAWPGLAEALPHADHQRHGHQRISSDFEEVLVGLDVIPAQQALQYRRQFRDN